MNTTRLLTVIASSLVMGQALAIDAVYDGDNGIRAKVLATNCLACHSSTLTGGNRNGAPAGVDFDTYEMAVARSTSIIGRAVMMMNMPPAFSPLPVLDDEQKQALKNWQALGFPDHTLPPIYSSSSAILSLPNVYIKDEQGDIVRGGEAKMALIPGQPAIQFELTHFQEMDAENSTEHVHP